MTSTITFGKGQSYVIFNSSITKESEPRVLDKYGRSEKDRQYLLRYKKLFEAAASGDLSSCEKQINKGFREFDGVAFGKFSKDHGSQGLSPRKIAEIKGHTQIIKLFNAATSSVSNSVLSPVNKGLTADEQKKYQEYQELIFSPLFNKNCVIENIKSGIASSYTLDQLMSMSSHPWEKCKTQEDWILHLQKRLEQTFDASKRDEYIYLVALKDSLNN